MKLLLFILIPIFLLLMIVIAYCKNENLVTALIDSVIVLSILVLGSSVFLSIFHAVSFWAVFFVWLIAVLVEVTGVVFLLRNKRTVLSCDIICFKSLNISIKLGLLALSLLLAATFCLSLFTPQYCGDCLTYHMPRVMHWINDKTIYNATFNTYDLREILSPVMAELYVLHAYVLSGSDFFSNLFQWGAYLISIVVLYGCIFKICRISKGISALALGGALLFASIPIAIAETTTTQNDLCGTMWVMLFIYTVIDLFNEKEITLSSKQIYCVVKMGMIIGFAYICKTNACIPIAGFLILLVIKRLCNGDKLYKIGCAIIIAMLSGLAIAMPYFSMMYYYLGTIIPSKFIGGMMVGAYDPKLLALNAFKNFAQIINNDWMGNTNIALKVIGRVLSGLFGRDINDPAITFSLDFYDCMDAVWYGCDTAPQEWISILIILSVLTFILIWIYDFMVLRKLSGVRLVSCFDSAEKWILWSIIIGSIMTFSLIKWQEWVTRLVLPCTATWCIFVVIMYRALKKYFYENYRINLSYLYAIIIFAALLLAMKPVNKNLRKPWECIIAVINGNREITLVGNSDVFGYEDYKGLESYLLKNGCERLGYYKAYGNEYTLLALINDIKDIRHVTPIEIEQGAIDPKQDNSFIPDHILIEGGFKEDTITYMDISYSRETYKECPEMWSLYCITHK